MSFYSGAGTIFGATVVWMEAAIRSAYLWSPEKTWKMLKFKDQGLEGVKEASVEIPGLELLM
jgi:iron only hydrogenase large subunit-like protein